MFSFFTSAKASWQQCSKTMRAVNFFRFPLPLTRAIMNQAVSLAVLLFAVPFLQPHLIALKESLQNLQKSVEIWERL
jgi:hypothetical protein